MNDFVYHLCAADFHGATLYPLNQLRQHLPDFYERERSKYAGREAMLTFPVPHTGAEWADTVNLSALDPRELIAARRHLGIPLSRLLERRLARIPVDRLTDQPAAYHVGRTHWINTAPGLDVPTAPPAREFTPFDPASYVELAAVPPAHLAYLRRQQAASLPALGFVFIPHILYAGSIDLTGIELIELDAYKGRRPTGP